MGESHGVQNTSRACVAAAAVAADKKTAVLTLSAWQQGKRSEASPPLYNIRVCFAKVALCQQVSEP